MNKIIFLKEEKLCFFLLGHSEQQKSVLAWRSETTLAEEAYFLCRQLQAQFPVVQKLKAKMSLFTKII